MQKVVGAPTGTECASAQAAESEPNVLKVSDNPPIIWPEGSVADIVGTWSVAHTKARFEKAFAWEMLRTGIPFFLPMFERLTFSGGRKRRGMMPLFSGYVFFAGDETARHRALMTNRLCQVVPAADQATLVQELSSLQVALESKATLDPYPHAVVGRHCRIAAGPFQGIEGMVVRRDNTYKLVLQVSLLGQSVAMEVEAGVVEPSR